MSDHNLLIVPQPVQAKAATSTIASALRNAPKSEATLLRAIGLRMPTQALAGSGR